MTDTADPDPFEHPALRYSGLDQYLAVTVPFIHGGLARAEPVAVAVPGPNLAALRSALGADADRVQLTDMTEAGANPGRIIPGVLRAFADEHRGTRVRIVGEPVWPGRSDAAYPACAQHEALINRAFAGREAAILCPYDVDTLDERVLADAAATHPVLIGPDGPRRSDAFDPDRVLARYNRPLEDRPRTAIERGVDAASVDNARWFVTAYGRKAGLEATRLIDLEIAVTELLTNSVEHGGGAGLLRVWTDAEHLLCEISDAGRLTDPLAGRRPPGPEQERGRGLLLVNHVTDLVRTHTGPRGTTTRIYLRLNA